ncbi:MAG TPA: hypothetical protein VGM30_21505 [Puia sp.]
MKNNLKNLLGAFALLLITGVFAAGCVEHRYVHEHHHHSPEYYHRHHQTPPPGVDIDIHN